MKPEYSFCETIAAYVWHIRKLTDKGRKLGGGADTKAICGAKVLWDLQTEVSETTVGSPRIYRGICLNCRQQYFEIKNA